MTISKMFQQRISSRAAPLDAAVSEPVEEKPENSLRHHHHPNFLSKNNDNINVDNYDDVDSDGGDRTAERKNNDRHIREVDPQLRWRDFGRNKTRSGPTDETTMAARRHYDDSFGEKECDDDRCIYPIEDNDQGTKECKEFVFGVLTNRMEADVASPTSVIPSLSPLWCPNEIDAAGKQQRGPTSTDSSHDTPFSVSLEEGWKGIMAASFGVASAAAASTAPPPSEASITTSARSSGDDESQATAIGRGNLAPCAASSALSEIWSFASNGAWVPVLCDDENATGGASPSPSPSPSSRNNHSPVYAALVLDSMLGPETDDDKEKLSGKEDDSLLWTWVGGDRGNDERSGVVPSPPPPTREIVFDVSWNDTVVVDDDDEDSPSPSPHDDGDEIPTIWGGDNNTNNNDDDEATDGHSLSLMAGSTYSRVFGLDYIDSNRSRSYDEELEENEDDWCIERPIRIEIPFGDGSTGTTRGNVNSNSNNTAVLARVGGISEQEREIQDIAATEFDRRKCIWITAALVIGFLFLVLMFAALFYAIEAANV
jgi:hypothetical protein